jgi:hypothetical protein
MKYGNEKKEVVQTDIKLASTRSILTGGVAFTHKLA